MTSSTSSPSPRIALVTGANKGVGRTIAQQLAELGMTVWLGARDPERGKQAESELRDLGLDVRFIRLDVTDEATVALAAEHIGRESGRLDVPVNTPESAALGTCPARQRSRTCRTPSIPTCSDTSGSPTPCSRCCAVPTRGAS
ncbi:SDR family NAD(P)-dependent oxidoreductase [Streptomyces sp. NPDC021225]|uniref:SDR family NAD(P)-dependent oxidoreductase n=1 Tax=Streptomyces sp. NPDC021225 TaxID=3365121 RepID=UPI0037B37740